MIPENAIGRENKLLNTKYYVHLVEVLAPPLSFHDESGGGGGALGFLLGLSAVGGRAGAGGSGDEGAWEPGV